MSPLFITFEGLDGSGKSTHLRRASEWLTGRGIPHRVTHEPGGTPLGDALRAIFLDPGGARSTASSSCCSSSPAGASICSR